MSFATKAPICVVFVIPQHSAFFHLTWKRINYWIDNLPMARWSIGRQVCQESREMNYDQVKDLAPVNRPHSWRLWWKPGGTWNERMTCFFVVSFMHPFVDFAKTCHICHIAIDQDERSWDAGVGRLDLMTQARYHICGKTPTPARARKGEAQGVLSYQNHKGIFDIFANP